MLDKKAIVWYTSRFEICLRTLEEKQFFYQSTPKEIPVSHEQIITIASILCLFTFVLEFYYALRIARKLLPKVRQIGLLSPEERVRRIRAVGKITGETKWRRIIIVGAVYIPFLLWYGSFPPFSALTWSTGAFLFVLLLHLGLIWVANNHDKIVELESDKLPLGEQLRLLELLEAERKVRR